MALSAEGKAGLAEEVERVTGETWDEWKAEHLAPGYKQHFHRNRASGDYPAMREVSVEQGAAFQVCFHCLSI
eukprot:SAG22_NODE_5095_length_1087_cov_1.579960_2_plen_72_part_00